MHNDFDDPLRVLEERQLKIWLQAAKEFTRTKKVYPFAETTVGHFRSKLEEARLLDVTMQIACSASHIAGYSRQRKRFEEKILLENCFSVFCSTLDEAAYKLSEKCVSSHLLTTAEALTLRHEMAVAIIGRRNELKFDKLRFRLKMM